VNCSVVIVLQEIIKVEYNENKYGEWIASDSDRLMPKGSMLNNLRWKFLSEIDTLNNKDKN